MHAEALPKSSLTCLVELDSTSLRRLTLWFGSRDRGANETVDKLEPLLRGDRLPRLELLGLANSGIQDEIAEALTSAPVLARLRFLDLSRGSLTDAGADALLAHADRFDRIERIDLRDNLLSPTACARLRARFGDAALVEAQRSAPAEELVLDFDEVELDELLDPADTLDRRAPDRDLS